MKTIGNPYCPDCKKLTKLVNRLIWDKQLPHRKGMAKFYECPKCKSRWKQGASIISKKPGILTNYISLSSILLYFEEENRC